MNLIVGLGNPGFYESTRHNAGFLVLDAIVSSLGLLWKYDKSLASHIAKGEIFLQKVLFSKPSSYMNLSGTSVFKVLQYYKLKIHQMIIIHDDLDLPFAAVKAKLSGGHGGHNGIRHILDTLGENQFGRIKIGIGRPQNQKSVKDWVLTPFQKEELVILKTEVLEKVMIRLKNILQKNYS